MAMSMRRPTPPRCHYPLLRLDVGDLSGSFRRPSVRAQLQDSGLNQPLKALYHEVPRNLSASPAVQANPDEVVEIRRLLGGWAYVAADALVPVCWPTSTCHEGGIVTKIRRYLDAI